MKGGWGIMNSYLLKDEGIMLEPESTYATAQVIREVEQARMEGKPKTILLHLSGHSLLDLKGYQDYFDRKLHDLILTEEELKKGC